MNDLNEDELKAEIDAIVKKVDTIIRRIDELDPAKQEGLEKPQDE